jgi:hypothetical protein
MWFNVFILLVVIVTALQWKSRMKKLELQLKELQWKVESMEHVAVNQGGV